LSYNLNQSKANDALVIDSLDIKIIRELLNNPDSSSSQIAKKLSIPLSTIQRRKTRLERSLLRRKYDLNIHDLGWRNAEILMLVGNGAVDRVARELIEKYDNITNTSIRINTRINLAACVGYRNSDELHELIEKLRAMPNISNLEWSEIVRESENKNLRLAHLIFSSSE
jgi:DNA-binding Lrp family transcriptional regulator